MKNKGLIISIAVVALLAIWAVSIYNSLAKAEVSVDESWANVESQYQRRADLIPNLVNIVKGYAAHEKSTLEEVVAARAKATSINVDASNLSAEKLKEFQAAQSNLSSSLGRLIAISENYPDLKANQNFLELQAQLEGTENRIQVARETYNKTAGDFNRLIRVFPKNIVANFAGFERKPFFDAEQGSEKAPVIEF
jgi:LemA protein